MAKSKSMYEKLGVDPGKENVRNIFKRLIDNEYPGAFVNIITDPFHPDQVLTQHQDGDGSKFIERLIHFYESGDESIFAGAVDDALSMNSGDIAACGFVNGPWLITDVLNANLAISVKETVMKVIASRFLELKELYLEYGIPIYHLGGETADLPDQVRSAVFDIAITAHAKKWNLITGNIKSGDLIFGFPSDGKAAWEKERKFPIMSNGLTLTRSCLMSKVYNEKYPHLNRGDAFYNGRFEYNDKPEILEGASVGEALCSPTRQWALVIREIVDSLKEASAFQMLHGISMNTGGGATKISHVGQGGILYVKDMPTPPGFFQLIQQESGERWENMFKTFNCGVGIDVVGENNPIFIEALKMAAKNCELPLYRLGSCQKLPGGENQKNEVLLNTPYGNFRY